MQFSGFGVSTTKTTKRGWSKRRHDEVFRAHDDHRSPPPTCTHLGRHSDHNFPGGYRSEIWVAMATFGYGHLLPAFDMWVFLNGVGFGHWGGWDHQHQHQHQHLLFFFFFSDTLAVLLPNESDDGRTGETTGSGGRLRIRSMRGNDSRHWTALTHAARETSPVRLCAGRGACCTCRRKFEQSAMYN